MSDSGPCHHCGALTTNREFVAWMREDWECEDEDACDSRADSAWPLEVNKDE